MAHSSTTLFSAHWLNSIYAFSCFCSSHFSSFSLTLSFDGSSTPFFPLWRETDKKKKKKIAAAVLYHTTTTSSISFPGEFPESLFTLGYIISEKRVGPSVSRALAVVFDWHPALERRRLCVWMRVLLNEEKYSGGAFKSNIHSCRFSFSPLSSYILTWARTCYFSLLHSVANSTDACIKYSELFFSCCYYLFFLFLSLCRRWR